MGYRALYEPYFHIPPYMGISLKICYADYIVVFLGLLLYRAAIVLWQNDDL